MKHVFKYKFYTLILQIALYTRALKIFVLETIVLPTRSYLAAQLEY